MRLIQLILPALVALTLVACQETIQDPPTPPAVDAEVAEPATQPQATAEQPAAQETSSEGNEGRGKGEIPGVSRDDAVALLNGRLLLTTFMIQTEGIAVPLAEQWKLEKVEGEGDNGRSFTFSSDDWTLILQEPAADVAGILYHVEISGPDLPSYIGDILIDGSVSPAQ